MESAPPKQRGELSPLDGRYREAVTAIRTACSERALVKYRLRVEVEYLKALNAELKLDSGFEASDTKGVWDTLDQLTNIHLSATIDQVFAIEKRTHHDVKAVEVAITTRLEQLSPMNNKKQNFASALLPYVHFGLTSQDITSVSLWLQLKHSRSILIESAESICRYMYEHFFTPYRDVNMLGRTHGQPATPTTLGKEFMVFIERLGSAKKLIDGVECRTKFGGATGCFNAHYLAFPDHDWHTFADTFLQSAFGMRRLQYTTQIDHYDGMAEMFHAVMRMNTVLIDLCRDVWQYISMGYLVQRPASKESVGSSTMPHKVNPIKFENAEGNLMIANSLLEFLARKLPVSRLQRDLTDSTVTRNIGTAFGHTYLAMNNVISGLKSIKANKPRICSDLLDHWEVVTEGVQTMLRSNGHDNAYDLLKNFVRNQVAEHGRVTREGLQAFIKETCRPIVVRNSDGNPLYKKDDKDKQDGAEVAEKTEAVKTETEKPETEKTE